MLQFNILLNPLLVGTNEYLLVGENEYLMFDGNPTPPPPPTIVEMNQQYQYTIEMLGGFNGQPLSGVSVPYPSIVGADGVEYIQLNAIQIGGFNGLNN
jgi:hypothetical protein